MAATKECVHREGLLMHKPLREQFAQAGYVPLGADRHLFHHPKANPPLYLGEGAARQREWCGSIVLWDRERGVGPGPVGVVLRGTPATP